MGLKLTKLGRASFILGIYNYSFEESGSGIKSTGYPWEDIDGNAHTLYTGRYNSPITISGKLYACSDIESDFVNDKSSFTQISNVTIVANNPSMSNVGDKLFRAFQITMSNSADSPVDVASLAFTQSLLYGTYAQYSAYGLTFMYYFKNPITIPANSSVNIIFNYGIDLSENL